MKVEMQQFEELVKIWNGWEIRVTILFSLFLQYILIIFGSRRKYIAKIWIRALVWMAYMTADWAATVALGILSKSSGDFEGNSSANRLQAFWAPFLLLHLGGPDTITAYALEDNNLWLRHLLGLLVQVGVAFFVFYQSWSRSAFTFLAIPVFVTGIIKYGERTWVLRSSSTKQFRDSLLSDPDPGPDYVKFVEAAAESMSINLDKNSVRETSAQYEEIAPRTDDNLILADYLFKRFKYLFTDLILGHHERIDCYNIIKNKSAEDAFKLIALELVFMYNVLYTKATIAHSQIGIILRLISFFSSISVLISFFVIIDKHAHPSVDVAITYMLLIGALALDVCGFILLIFSDWTKLWLTKIKAPQAYINCSVSSPSLSLFTNGKMWSESMAQYNLIRSCMYKPAKCVAVQKLFRINETVEKYHYRTWTDIDVSLQESIYKQLKVKGDRILNDSSVKKECKLLMARRGDFVLENMNFPDEFRWCTTDVEFDHSLLLWHIATDLCYYNVPCHGEACKISKYLSDYMLYLLVLCPSMLPKGIGEIRYRDTVAEAKRFFKQKGLLLSGEMKKASDALLQVNTDPLEEIKGDRSQSVLFYGCRLAQQLKSLDFQDRGGQEKKWEMISEVWVEMLIYAASRCDWKEHSQQLRKGGELLTHVCLLMAHFGLSEQYQIQKDYICQPDSVLEKVLSNKCFLCFLRCTL